VIKNDCIDFIVVGEGEETMLELSRYILGRNNSQDPSYIRGIVYRLGDKTVRTPPRPLIENLDDIPFPDREAVFVLDRYKQIITVYQNLDVLSSRGCPYRCKFCCAYLVWGTRKFRLRSVDNIIEELIILNRIYGQQSFVFWDDLFSLNKKRVMELCEKMIEQRLAIRWICLLRLDAIDSEMLDMMKRAGCTQIQIGIESGNDRILKHIGKNITLSQIYAKVPIIQRSGLEWLIFLVVGFPSETEDEINDTLRLISDIQPSQVGMSIFAPYPGTAFYNDLKEKGLLGDDIMKSDTWYPYNNFTGTIPDERFVKISINALEYADRYNLRKQLDRLTLKYVIAQLRNFWQQSDH
jgi:anaerobic magnesium-protoporphyrin IX monomethyl ester cyclase